MQPHTCNIFPLCIYLFFLYFSDKGITGTTRLMWASQAFIMGVFVLRLLVVYKPKKHQ